MYDRIIGHFPFLKIQSLQNTYQNLLGIYFIPQQRELHSDSAFQHEGTSPAETP